MAAVDDIDELLEQWQLAASEFVKGNPEPQKKLFFRTVSRGREYAPAYQVSGLCRIHLPRTPVNKGNNRKGRGTAKNGSKDPPYGVCTLPG